MFYLIVNRTFSLFFRVRPIEICMLTPLQFYVDISWFIGTIDVDFPTDQLSSNEVNLIVF